MTIRLASSNIGNGSIGDNSQNGCNLKVTVDENYSYSEDERIKDDDDNVGK